MKNTIFAIALLCLFFSCDKRELKKYAGEYECNRSDGSWSASEPAEYTIVPNQILDVERNKKFIELLDIRVHVDSIEPGEEYRSGDVFNYVTLRFSNDSIAFRQVQGNADSGTSFGYYGVKRD